MPAFPLHSLTVNLATLVEGEFMRALIVAAAFGVAACGQGGPLDVGSPTPNGWQIQEVRDELTGAVTQSAIFASPFDNGQVEMTATCKGNQFVFHFDEWGEIAPLPNMAQVVEFRMTVIPANADDTFSLANAGTQLGLQSNLALRASVQNGQEDRLVGFVDHINSVTTQIPVAAFYGADAISALRVELPLLLQSATSGQPPVSQNVVVDLMPQDENLRTLLAACDPSASEAASNTEPASAPAAPQMAAISLGPVSFDAVGDGAGCVAVNAEGQSVFVTDYSVGVIQINGTTVRLPAVAGGDGGMDGTHFGDGSGIVLRIVHSGGPTESGHESSATPANLTLTVDGSETAVPVSYRCEQ